MKAMEKIRVYAKVMLLLGIMTVFLAGCAAIDTGEMEQHVSAMLDCCAAEDAEGSYALLYPGAADEESFRESFRRIRESFPVTDGYTLSLENYHVTKQIGPMPQTAEQAQFRVEFDEQVFHVYTEYITDDHSSGFTVFRIIYQMDMIETG